MLRIWLRKRSNIQGLIKDVFIIILGVDVKLGNDQKKGVSIILELIQN